MAITLLICALAAADVPHYEKRATWHETLLATREAIRREARAAATPLPDFGRDEFTIAAWIRTTKGGTILARAPAKGVWRPQGKTFFVRGGRVCYDIGWVGCVTSRRAVTDGKWHHVALTKRDGLRIYIDGKLDQTGRLNGKEDVRGHVVKIGYTSTNFPRPSGFLGEIDELRVYCRALPANEIAAQVTDARSARTDGLAAYWRFDGDHRDASGNLNHAVAGRVPSLVHGKSGTALHFSGSEELTVPRSKELGLTAALWQKLRSEFADAKSQQEMVWEREDGIWGGDWLSISHAELAGRYANAIRRRSSSIQSSTQAKTLADLKLVRQRYLQCRRREQFLSEAGFEQLRSTIGRLYGDSPKSKALLARLAALERRALAGAADIERDLVALRLDVAIRENPLIDFDDLVFVKRHTYSANHYYTEYINSRWTPGGSLCVLSLSDGAVKELTPSLKGGVFGRFDVSFNAKRVVFGWKKAANDGYRIYEVKTDGTGLRQLTFPPANEAELVEKFRVTRLYHHGTDDMHPCYLPDGGIVFISTRCQYGILCDSPDNFTTTVLYRMDEDGKNLRRLSNSSVSEASPVVLPDGQIMYTRWEYLDKGAVSVKCLWAMRPDGSGSSEVYGNDLSVPPTLIYGRPVPGAPYQYVVLGTPHCPQNGVGTVIRLDLTRSIRTREPMTYMTPDVDIQREPGFAFRHGESWRHDGQGRGRLFKDPYPLSEHCFLVSHKPAGPTWADPKAYGLCILDSAGNVVPIYKDESIACWQPCPLRPRTKPPVIRATLSPKLAAQNLAACVVTDVYRGLEGVERGTIKHIRIIEQIPRPWATRRRWPGDCYDQQHACISKDAHLGLKVQHGIVPVEDDGSAHFVVPALANISLQVLDEHYLAVQTERTYVNYQPGEVRSCVGCHETPDVVTTAAAYGTASALARAPSVPGPQPGERSGKRPLHYPTDVQPVLDRHCVKCHSGPQPKAGLDLRGTPTSYFSVSYESLVPERRRRPRRDRRLLPVIGENHPKTGNVHYLPARSLGSHASVLVAMLSKGAVRLADKGQAERADKLAQVHKALVLKPEELLKITNWVDTNAQFYGSYWGRRNLRHRDHANFRPTPTFETARCMSSPIPEAER